jgi:hypothetical protein
MYAATYTRPTVRHVYSDRTRGELQVAKFMFFCSACILLVLGSCLIVSVRGPGRPFVIGYTVYRSMIRGHLSILLLSMIKARDDPA